MNKLKITLLLILIMFFLVFPQNENIYEETAVIKMENIKLKKLLKYAHLNIKRNENIISFLLSDTDEITSYFWMLRVKEFSNFIIQGYYDHKNSSLTNSNLLLIGIMYRYSASLGDYSFVKMNTNIFTHNFDSSLDRKQRRIEFMWLFSQYVKKLTGKYLKGYESKFLCNHMYTSNNYGSLLSKTVIQKQLNDFKNLFYFFISAY